MRVTLGSILIVLLLSAQPAAAHPEAPLPAAEAFLASLTPAQREAVLHPFDHRERFGYRWTPGSRPGVALSELSPEALARLRAFLTSVLSERGALTVDAVLATEAALGVIEGRPSYRDPERYYTALFGTPGGARWGLRFEGHHLSINITFSGAQAVSGTPLFLGANPETIDEGPHNGLRSMAQQVDLALALYGALSDEQRRLARDRGPGYGGFLTRAGSPSAPDADQPGIAWQDLSAAQQAQLRDLAISYIGLLNHDLSAAAIAGLLDQEAANLRFFWDGGSKHGESYYYRISGGRLFIEHDAMAGGTHIHAVLRDREGDWGGLR